MHVFFPEKPTIYKWNFLIGLAWAAISGLIAQSWQMTTSLCCCHPACAVRLAGFVSFQKFAPEKTLLSREWHFLWLYRDWLGWKVPEEHGHNQAGFAINKRNAVTRAWKDLGFVLLLSWMHSRWVAWFNKGIRVGLGSYQVSLLPAYHSLELTALYSSSVHCSFQAATHTMKGPCFQSKCI